MNPIKITIATMIVGTLGAGLLVTSLANAAAADQEARPAAGERQAVAAPAADEGGLAGGDPDVIVSSMASQITRYNPVGAIGAYSMTTVSCNIGTAFAEWFQNTPDHPVIAQNLYRLNGGRFEQIGISWLKHGFCAFDAPSCPGGTYVPYDHFDHKDDHCDWLGLFATDTYTADRNGDRQWMGPRSEVNPWTGLYPYPPVMGASATSTIAHRTQVALADINPAFNAGALYYGEVQYICTDEPTAMRYNNVSYRRFTVGSANMGSWNLSTSGFSTNPQQPGINAWKANDGNVVLTNIDVPGDGRMIVGYRATFSGGLWHYEMALYNMNSDRSAQSLSVPIPNGVTIPAVGFHDINYHSGEPYSGTDWSNSLVPGAPGWFYWATETHATNANANALRWGTLYNYRFDSVFPPKFANATIGLFKPGMPASMTVKVLGPTNCPADIAPNGTGNGTTDINDLLAIIIGWGPCASATDCAADVAPDGGNDVVDINDLLRVIITWGACPVSLQKFMATPYEPRRNAGVRSFGL